ncbi:CRE-TAG protein [Ditylenchus destructor]|nr:CRE-TAG protein [Ditylenchus destructor]
MREVSFPQTATQPIFYGLFVEGRRPIMADRPDACWHDCSTQQPSISTYNRARSSRTIVLIGEEGYTRGHDRDLSSLVDFMCNLFYEVHFESDFRYKIANERFDQSTPQRPVIKYVFNEAKITFRPVVIAISLPPATLYSMDIGELLSQSLPSNTELHSIVFVIPAKTQTSSFPLWLDKLRPGLFNQAGSLAVLISRSESEMDSAVYLLRRTGGNVSTHQRQQFSVFRTNTKDLFTKPTADHVERYHQQQSWNLTSENLRKYFLLVACLLPLNLAEITSLPAATSTPTLGVEPTMTTPLSPDSAIASLESSTGRYSARDRGGGASQTESPCSPPATGPLFPISARPTALGPAFTAKLVREEPTAIIGLPQSEKETFTSETMKRVICEQDSRYIVKEVEQIIRRGIGSKSDSVQFEGKESESRLKVCKEAKGRTERGCVRVLDLLRRYTYDPVSRTYKLRFEHQIKVIESTSHSTSGDNVTPLRNSQSFSDFGSVFGRPHDQSETKLEGGNAASGIADTRPRESQSARTSFGNNYKREKRREEEESLSQQKASSGSVPDLDFSQFLLTAPLGPTRLRISVPPPGARSTEPLNGSRTNLTRRAFERHSASRKPVHSGARRGVRQIITKSTENLTASQRVAPLRTSGTTSPSNGAISRPAIIRAEEGSNRLMGPELSGDMLKELLRPLSGQQMPTVTHFEYFGKAEEQQRAPLLMNGTHPQDPSEMGFYDNTRPQNGLNASWVPIKRSSETPRKDLRTVRIRTPTLPAGSTLSRPIRKGEFSLKDYCYYLFIPFLLILVGVAGVIAVVHYI